MKFCYTDESAKPEKPPVQTMVGIVVDAHRLSRTRTEFGKLFEDISCLFPSALKELKGSRIFYGKGGWRDVDPGKRKEIFHRFCGWLKDRKHTLALSAIDTERFRSTLPEKYPDQLKDLWIAGAMHIALQVQKGHQKQKKNKGQTILIFDENKMKGDTLVDVLYEPDDWTDDYYDRGKKQEKLDQIIDSSFYAKSHHAGLVQVSDLFAFAFRRYSELKDFGEDEEFAGEFDDIEKIVDQLAACLIEGRHRWPKKTNSECAQTFADLVPDSLQSF
ncbi:MAG: DUF3800 domain-containing protein [Methyloligella sp. ZOD6]